MGDYFTGRPNAARLDDLVAANPKDRAFIDNGAAEYFCPLRTCTIYGFLHIFVLFRRSGPHDTVKRMFHPLRAPRRPVRFACRWGVRLYSASGLVSKESPAANCAA